MSHRTISIMDLSKSATSLFCSFSILISISAGVSAIYEGKCRGPTAYYDDLGCVPIFMESDDPCPYQYDCHNLTKKSSYHCYGNSINNSTHEIDYNCAPTYTYTQSPQIDCSNTKRCQNNADKVIRKNLSAGSVEHGEMFCVFGTLRMRYGDELNVATAPDSACMHCVCEVGPIPTCQRFSPERCVVKVMNIPRYDVSYIRYWWPPITIDVPRKNQN